MIPEEDRPPSWLRDFGDIEVDIHRMEEFAAQLDKEVRDSYMPHLQTIEVDVTTRVPAQHPDFKELFDFLTAHRDAQVKTYDSVYTFRDATGGFAYAAKKVSENYAGADAFASARAREVEAALNQTAVAEVPPPGSTSTPGGDPPVPPVLPPVVPPTGPNGQVL